MLFSYYIPYTYLPFLFCSFFSVNKVAVVKTVGCGVKLVLILDSATHFDLEQVT